MNEKEELKEDQCGVTDPHFVQCRLKYGHKELHDFPKEEDDQGELF